MQKALFSVGAMTLLSRATGFFRDIMLGAILGAGLMADAFVVANRLPNHFRAIFGEGAFNAAYVPCYAGLLETKGLERAKAFASEILSLLLASQLVLLGAAWLFMPQLVDLLAPGFRDDPEKFDLAVTLTRITFPYLLFITLVTLQSGTLNALGHFTAAAFAPVLLNVVMIICLALAFLFPNAGYAASWGVTISGVAQLLLVMGALWRAGGLERLAVPRWDEDVKKFFRILGPAVVGSAGVQIALFADTIIASLMPTGVPSAFYYADRIYQLPIGVIGIAAGTVLLPEMSRRFAAGDAQGAFAAQNRTLSLSLVLTVPFFIAFIMIPQSIMRGVFMRGAFSEEAVETSAMVLQAYGFGLLAIVLIRSVVASFQSQGDTRTPMIVSLISVTINVVLKILLFKPFGAASLAMATAIGAWINLLLLTGLALRKGSMQPSWALLKTLACVSMAGFALSFYSVFADIWFARLAQLIGTFGNEIALVLLGGSGALIYFAAVVIGLAVAGILPARLTKLVRR